MERALEIVARLEADPVRCAACIADAYVALGDVERALHWLDAAIPEGFESFYFPKVDPLYAPLQSDPRFVRFLKEMSLVTRGVPAAPTHEALGRGIEDPVQGSSFLAAS